MSLSRLTKQNHMHLLLGLIVGSLIIECSFRFIELTPLWKVLPVAEISLFKPDYYSGYRFRENVEGIWTTENACSIEYIGDRRGWCRCKGNLFGIKG